MGQPQMPQFPEYVPDQIDAIDTLNKALIASADYLWEVVAGKADPEGQRISVAMKLLDEASLFAAINPASPTFVRAQEMVDEYRESGAKDKRRDATATPRVVPFGGLQPVDIDAGPISTYQIDGKD